ncbi:L,D-transpeptidase family protein [Flavobacterium psychrotolerans]|uniref:Murein L,D-transpeptidase n=1 Tax=Flavobacterium psychrotolerans TaxID=2169410 RepID=A0A2U1JQ57_9FLAO|nr:L,D-transpeptidase family protein [Flavobacterium psychrotolerans]PWA07307.1 murein L,D-transpeptidase [Flavobacterium psychrotolerans]
MMYSKIIISTGFDVTLKSKLFFIILTIFLISGCKKDSKSSIYSNKNYTDLVLDETAINSFFKMFPQNDGIKNEVNEFYRRREYQFAWFNNKGMTAAVPNFYNQIQNYRSDFGDKNFGNTALDSLITLLKTDDKPSLIKENRVKELELLLTTTFFIYSKKVYGGITKSPKELDWFIPRKKKNYQALLDSLVVSDKGENPSEPVNHYYTKLKENLRKYRVIYKKGGFPAVVTSKKVLLVTESDTCLLNLKKYLFLTGDLKANDRSIIFTDELAKAVKKFQHRMGLNENGKINAETIHELNKPISLRIKQMMVNLERLRWVPVKMENEYLLVNIPEFKLHIIENNQLIWTTNVVVGKDVKQTNIFKGNISKIILNPYWNIPNSIIKDEIVPNIKKNSNYLATNNMEVLSGNKVIDPLTIDWNKYENDIPFTIRQKPGMNNALGKMKFLFPNNFNIYLHDTPSKSNFSEKSRAFSHGCIRVENPKKLVLYFLRKDKTWNATKVDSITKTEKEFSIPIKPSVPVYLAYFTSWVDSAGQLNFRNDIYNLDEQLANEIFGE